MQSSNQGKIISFKYIFLCLIVFTGLHYTTFVRMFSTTLKYQENWYSLLVPLFIFAVLYKKFHTLQFEYNPWAPAVKRLYILAGITYIAGSATNILFLLEFAMITHVCALTVSVLAADTLKELWPLILFLYALIPPPLFVSSFIFAPLKGFYSKIVSSALITFDFPLLTEGSTIFFPAFNFKIVDECSGFRTLLTLILFAFPFVTLAASTVKRRVWLILLSVPIALGANFLRIFSTALAGLVGGHYLTVGIYHTLIGFFWTIWAFAALIVISMSLDSERYLVRNQIVKHRPPFLKALQPFFKQIRFIIPLIILAFAVIILYPHLRPAYKNARYYARTASSFSVYKKYRHTVNACYKHFRNEKMPNTDVLKHYTMAMMALDRTQEAIDTLEKIHHTNSNVSIINAKPGHLYLLCLLYFDKSDFNTSLYLLNNARRKMSFETSSFLKMLNYFGLEQFDHSVKILDELLIKDPENLLYIVLKAECLIKMGKPGSEIKDILNLLYSQQGGPASIHKVMGNFYSLNDQPYTALSCFEEAFNNSQDKIFLTSVCTAALITAAQITDRKHIEKWLARLEKLDQESIFFGLFKSIMSFSNSKKGLKMLNQAFRGQNIDSVTLGLLEASVAIKAGAYEKAEKVLNLIFEKEPSNYKARVILAELFFSKKDYTSALALVDIMKKEHKDQLFNDPMPVFFNIKALFMKGDYQACLNEIRANKSTLQANAGFNTTASVYEAACLTAIGSTIEAAQLADDLVLPGQGKDIPDYNEKYILAQIYDKAKMHDKAAVLYLECTSYPDIAPLCHNNLAWYFLDKNMLVQSVKQASLAVKHAPDNPSIMDTAAWVSYKSGDTKKSLQIYSKLVKKHFKASYIFNYIKVLKAVGDQKGLNDLVEYALKKTDDLLVRAAILELAGKRGEK